MCNASLESKYKYLFHLVGGAYADGVDHKRMAVLFYDLIHIPKFLGEAAAFGGSNIEPSVRSCFEHAKFPPTMDVNPFLAWLKKEPQSLVWLAVMHRLASSEFAKHQAKCNACKMYPIVGMRYRCLRCFNFDICQNCFFSQRTAKNHKLTHPMQEYCFPTHAKDDVRDFTEMVRNKVRKSKSRPAYLPVEQVNEGRPLEKAEQSPQNSATESIHLRMHLFAQRLDLHRRDLVTSNGHHPQIGASVGKSVSIAALPPSGREGDARGMGEWDEWTRQEESGADIATNVGELKSPSQLLTQVGQMHKEELDALLDKLQFENMQLRRAMEEKRRATGQYLPKSTPNLHSDMPHYALQSSGLSPASGRQIQYTTSQAQQQLPGALYSSMHLPNWPDDDRRTGMDRTSAAQVSTPYIPLLHHANTDSGGRMAPTSGGRPPLPTLDGMTPIPDETVERQVMAEAKNLRLQQQRLEQRSRLLEDQNRQLQMQLDRLNQMVEKQKSTSALDTGWPLKAALNGETSATIPRTATVVSGAPAALMPYAPHVIPAAGAISSTEEEDEGAAALGRGIGGMEETEIRRSRMDKLMSTVEELNRAMESFVESVVVDGTGGRDGAEGAVEEGDSIGEEIANGEH